MTRNHANVREPEDWVKRRKVPGNSSRLRTNLIVSNVEDAEKIRNLSLVRLMKLINADCNAGILCAIKILV